MPGRVPESDALQACYRLLETALVATSSRDFFEKTLDIFSESLGAKRVSLILKSHGGYHFAAGRGIAGSVLKTGKVTVGGNVLAEVIAEGGVFCSDMDQDDRFGKNKKLRYRSKTFVCVPCVDHELVTGFLSATEPDGKKTFGESELSTAVSLAQAFVQGLHAVERKSEHKPAASEWIPLSLQKLFKGLPCTVGQTGDFSKVLAEAMVKDKESVLLWLADSSRLRHAELGEQAGVFRLAALGSASLPGMKQSLGAYQNCYGTKPAEATILHIQFKEKSLRLGASKFGVVYFSREGRSLSLLKETSGDKSTINKSGDVLILTTGNLLGKTKNGWSKEVLLSLLLKKRSENAQEIAEAIKKERAESSKDGDALVVLRFQ